MDLITLCVLICSLTTAGHSFENVLPYNQQYSGVSLNPHYDNALSRLIPFSFGGIITRKNELRALISSLKGLSSKLDDLQDVTERLKSDYETAKEVSKLLADQYRIVASEYSLLKLKIQELLQKPRPTPALACGSLGGVLVDRYCLYIPTTKAADIATAATICFNEGGLLATPFWEDHAENGEQFATEYVNAFTSAVAETAHWIGVRYTGTGEIQGADVTAYTILGDVPFQVTDDGVLDTVETGITMAVIGTARTYTAEIPGVEYLPLCQYGLLVVRV